MSRSSLGTHPAPRSRATAAAPPAPSLTVRCARTGDVRGIAPLFDAYRQFYGAVSDVAGARRFLLERLARNESVVFIASPIAGGEGDVELREPDVAEVVGFAQLYPSFSSVALRPIIILNDLYVAPAWRRAHVARRLIKEVVGYATRLGASRLDLSTQHTNSAALQLYSSIGFTSDVAFSHLSLELHRAR